MQRPVFHTLAACFTLACALASSPVLAQAQPKIGLVMKSLADEFFKDMTNGAITHQKKRGDFELKTVGMKDETDFDAQTTAVKSFVTQGRQAAAGLGENTDRAGHH